MVGHEKHSSTNTASATSGVYIACTFKTASTVRHSRPIHSRTLPHSEGYPIHTASPVTPHPRNQGRYLRKILYLVLTARARVCIPRTFAFVPCVVRRKVICESAVRHGEAQTHQRQSVHQRCRFSQFYGAVGGVRNLSTITSAAQWSRTSEPCGVMACSFTSGSVVLVTVLHRIWLYCNI